ncbi:MAG: DUF11 domain-containing protein [Anaerolineales bacterium]|nr:DUF11 domain-containing protein [Anaerolineales bacterium]
MRLFNKYLVLLVVMAMVMPFLSIPPNIAEAATITIDGFDTDQATLDLVHPGGTGSTTGSTVTGGGMLGGERDVRLTLNSGIVPGNGVHTTTAGGFFSYGQDPTANGSVQIQWDGVDGDFNTLNATGLGGVDLTGGGTSDAFIMGVLFDDLAIDVAIEVYTDAGNASTRTLSLPGSIFVATEVAIPFSSFTPTLGGGANFGNVGAITLSFTSPTAPDIVLDFFQTSTILNGTKEDLLFDDVDGSGNVTPGDVLEYTVLVTNPPDPGGLGTDATNVVYTDTLDPRTTLIVGSVTTTQGTIVLGNGGGDTSVQVDIGTIVDGAIVTITYRATINTPWPGGNPVIENQGTITSDQTPGGFPTDDPDDPTGDDDPTGTPISIPPDLGITKDDGGATVNPGGTVVYTLDYINNGGDATGVFLQETVPANTTFNPGASSPGWVCVPNNNAGSTCTLFIGPLAQGASNSALFAVTVDNPLPAGVDTINNTAIIGDDGLNGPDSNPGDNSDPDDTPANGQPDMVMTSKSDGGAANIPPGGLITYTLNYANNGNQDATGVVLTETVPANTTFNPGASTAGWVCVPNNNAGSTCTLAIGAVAAGGGGSATFAVNVNDPLPAGVTQVNNTGCVNDDGSNGADPNPGNDCASDDTSLDNLPDLSLTKDDGGFGPVSVGGVVIYTLTYTNNGTQASDANTVITETVPVGTQFIPAFSDPFTCVPDDFEGSTCTLNIGSVPAGGSGSVAFAVQLLVPVPSGQTDINNSACIADGGANGADTNPANDCDNDNTPIDAVPDLGLTKSDGGATTTPGGTVAYTLTYTNFGDQDATNVVITETVPANTTFNPGASTAGWVCLPNNNAGSTCTINVGSVTGFGGTGNVTFAVDVVNPVGSGVTQISNGACVADDGANGADSNPGNDCDNDTTPLNATPDLDLTKDDGGASAIPGGTIAYTLTATNNGDQAAVNITFTDTVPANTTFNAGASTAGWICVPDNSAGSVCTLTIPGPLAGGGGSANVTFAVTVDNPLPGGVTQVSNSACAADDGSNGPDPTTPNCDNDDTPISAEPDMAITKDDGGVTVLPGGTIVYALNYSNIGTIGATGVVITETVPANSTFNPGASTAGWVCVPDNSAGSICTFAVAGTVAAGGGGSVNFAVDVDPIPMPAGVDVINNNACIADDGNNGTDPNMGNNCDPDDTPVDAAPELSLTKDDGGATVTPGGTVAYTLTYTNNGTQGAANVVITETVPANTTFNPGASTAGWVCLPNNNAGSICTINVGTVAGNGGTGNVTFAVDVVNPVSDGVTDITNAACVADDGANGPDTAPGNECDNDNTPLTANPDLDLTKDDGGANAIPGGTIAYTLTATNNGNIGATTIAFTDTVPANTTFNPGASTAGWVCLPNNNAGSNCTLLDPGPLAGGGGSLAVVFAVTVDNPLPGGVTQVSNSACVTDDGFNGPDPTTPNCDNDDTPISAEPDMAITKDDGGATVLPGGTIAYTLSYQNIGTIGATGVVIDEIVPLNTTFNAGASTAGWVCVPDNSAGSFCTFAVAGTVAAGGGGVVTFAVDVDPAPMPAGVDLINNNACISDDGNNGTDPNLGNNCDPDDTPVDATPELGVVKDDGGATATPGGTVAYTLTYINNGTQDATNVVITDVVPNNATFNPGASTAGWACLPDNSAGSTCTINVGTVAGNGGTGNVTFAVDVDDPLAAGEIELDNTACVADDGANGSDPNGANDCGNDNTPIDAAPELGITKDDGGASSVPGGVIAYTLTYINNGNQDATNVTLTDIVPANTTFNPGASTGGWVCAPDNTVGSVCTINVGTVAGGGGTGNVTFAVTVNDPVPAGTTQVSNNACVADDGANGPDTVPGNDCDNDDTPVTASVDLVITKDDGGATVLPGGTIAYTLSYQNVGSIDATGVVITETVPANSTFNAGASTAGWVCVPDNSAGSTCTLAIGTVNAGAGGSVTFAVDVDPAPMPAGLDLINNTGCIGDDGASGPDATPGDNCDTDTTPVDAAPELGITKDDGGATTTPGGTVTYTLTYINNGPQAATNVILTDIVPANATFNPGASTGGWVCVPDNSAGSTCTINVGTVAGNGGTGNVTFAVDVANPLPAGVTDINNNACVADDGANGADTNPANDCDPDNTPVDAAPDLTVVKDDGGASSVPGGTVVYTLNYNNIGNQGATNVTITETVPVNTTFDAAGSLPTVWSCADNSPAGTPCTVNVGSVAAGAGGNVTFAVTIDDPVPAGTTQVSNSACVADDGANGADQNPGDNCDNDDTPVTANVDMVITKDDGGATVLPGGVITYTLSYQNVGTIGATGVVITETVPANSTFNAAGSLPTVWSCADGSPAGTPCTVNVGAVPAGTGGSVTFAVLVDPAPMPNGLDLINNTGCIADDGASGPDPNPGDNCDNDNTPVDAAPELGITKDDGGTTTTAGGVVIYTLTYINNGNQDANNVTITDTVPVNTTFNAGSSSAGWSCADGDPAGSVCTNNVGLVAGNGGTGNLNFAVNVASPLASGVTDVNNNACVADDGANGPDTVPGNDCDPDNTPIDAAPDLVVTKDEGGAVSIPGSVIVYTISYSNVGDQDATGVVITETVPANTTFDLAGSTVGWSCADGAPAGTNCTFNIGNLAAGANGTVDFAVQVDNPLPAGVTQVDNTVCIADDGNNGPDQFPSDNCGNDTTTVVAEVDLQIAKDDGGTTTVPGGVVIYNLLFTNVGTVGASGVVISDTVPANSTFNLANSTAGWSCADGAPAGSICTLNVGNVGVGAVGSADFAVNVVNPLPAGITEIDNLACIADDGTWGADVNPADNCEGDDTPVDAQPDLTIVKDDGGVTTTPGGVVVYTLDYANVGNQDATGVVISDTVPVNATFNLANSTAGWSCADGAPAGTVCTFAVGNLASGANGSVDFAVNVDNPLPAGVTQIDNVSTIADDGNNGPDPTPPNNTDPDFTPVDANPDVTITKDDGGATGVPGGVVVYVLTYSNIGNQEATGVVVTETVPVNTTFNLANSTAGWSCADNSPAGTNCTFNIGNLAGGANGSINFAVNVVTPLPAGVTELLNDTCIAEDGSNGPEPTGNNCDSDNTPLNASPNITATKVDALFIDVDTDGLFDPGDTLQYTIVVTNSGDQDAANVVFSDVPDANTTLVVGSVTTSQGTVTVGNTAGDTSVGVNLGTIAGNGANATITFEVTLDSPLPANVTETCNQGSFTGDNFPTEPTDDPSPVGSSDPTCTPTSSAPIIDATKVDTLVIDVNGSGFAGPGDTLEYTMVITNSGDQDAANVIFADTPDGNTTLVVGSVTTTQGTVNIGNNVGDTTVEVALGTLPGGGGTATVTFRVTINNPLPTGTSQVVNQGTVDGDNFPPVPTDDPDFPSPDDPTPTPISSSPNIVATKDSSLLVDADTSGTLTPGDTLLYTVNINNVGGADATNVFFDDTPDVNTTLVFGTVTTTQGTVTIGNGGGDTSVQVSIGTMPASSGVIVTFQVTINDPLPVGVTSIANQGFVSGDDFPDEPTDDPGTPGGGDPTDDPIGDNPIIDAYKISTLYQDNNGNGVANPGDRLLYTIDIVNSGAGDALNVVFTDTPDPNTTLVVGTVTVNDGTATIDLGNGAGDTSVQVSIPTIAAGNTVQIRFQVEILPVTSDVTLVVNQGTVSGDNFPSEPTDDPNDPGDDDPNETPIDPEGGDEPPAVIFFDPSISKIGILEDGGIGLPGEDLTWVLTITNIGNVTGTDIYIVDTVISELQVNGADIDRGTATIEGQTVTFYIPTLAPGESIQARIYTTVLSSPADGTFLNIATLTGNGPNGQVVTASATGEVFGVTGLPDTGYPPVDEKIGKANDASRLPILPIGGGIAALLGAAGAAVWAIRKRS